MKRIFLFLLLTANFAFSQIDISGTKREQISFDLYDDFKYIQELDPTFIFKKDISVYTTVFNKTDILRYDIFESDGIKVFLSVYPTNSIEYRITITDKEGKITESYGFMKKLGKNRMLSVTYANDKNAVFQYFLNKDKVHSVKN